MAIYTTQASQTYAIIPGQTGAARSILCQIGSIALTTAMLDNANDEIELCWVPKGAVITGAEVRFTDVDGGTAFVWDLGDDGVEDRLIAASTVGQAAGLAAGLAATGWGYKYSTATKIKLYVKTAAGTPATGTVYYKIEYFVDEGFTLANAVVS
jgi:hypothetical protein